MAASSEEKVSLRTWVAVLGTVLGAFMAVLDIQITNASLREITGGIGSTAVEASWVSTSYLIGEIITIPLTAWLGRVFGVRLYLLVNVSLFLVFSGLCGTASELTQMIIYRALQGFTGGVMIPMSFTVINTQLPPSRRPLGLVLFGITATLAPAIGPYIGGLLTDNYGWPMVFYVNFIPGAVMLATVFFAIDPQPLNMPLLWKGDWLGTAFMAIGLGSLIAFLEEGQNDDWFTSVFIQRCFTLAVIFIPLFIICELVSKTPVVNLRLLRIRNLGLASAVNFLLGASLYGSVFLLPEYLEQVQNYSASQTGEAMVLIGLPQLLIFPFVPRLMKSVRPAFDRLCRSTDFRRQLFVEYSYESRFWRTAISNRQCHPRSGATVHHRASIRACYRWATEGTTGGRIGSFQYHEKSGWQRRNGALEHHDHST